MKFTSFFLGFLVFINFHWLLPYLSNLKEIFESAHPPVLLSDINSVRLTSVKFSEAIRMLGYWSMKSGYKGEPYYSFWQYYQRPLVKLISWLIPILVGLGIWEIWKKNKTLKFFLLSLTVFGLIGINGAHPPFGKFFLWLCRLLPSLALLFRFNFLFFGMPAYLGLSLLVGCGALAVYRFGRKQFGQMIWGVLGILAVLLGVVLVWPFWNGEVIKSEGKVFPGERFQIPDYWLEAKNWLTNQKDFFRILPLPMSKTYNTAFYWGEGYSGADMSRWFVPQPMIYLNTGDSFKIPELIGNLIENESNFKDVAKLLGYLNVRYLLLRNDTRWEFLQGHGWWFHQPPERIEKFIQNQNDLNLEKEIGQLKFYQVADKYLLPRIYVPQAITYINGEVASLEDLAQFLKPEEKEAFILREGGREEEEENYNHEVISSSAYIWRQPTIPEQDGKSDFTRAVYQLSISEKGKYEILLRDNGFLDFYQGDKVLGVKIDDGKTEEKSFASAGDNLISFGEIEFNEGDHTITIFPPSPINLVDDRSAGRSFKITADKSEKIVTFPIKDFKVGEAYGISLSVKNVLGNRPLLLFWENYIESTKPVFDQRSSLFGQETQETAFSKFELPADTDWQNYNFTIKPNPHTRSVGLSLASSPSYSDGISLGKTENHFDNLQAQRIFTNPMVLRRIDGGNQGLVNSRHAEFSSASSETPEINFKKISSVKHEVTVENAKEPYWLVFSESFHPGWKLSVEGRHEVINGFANGWYIEKMGDYEMDIYFTPQRYLYIGMAVSGLTILFSLAYLLCFSGR